MLCQECGAKQATFHLKKYVNGEKTEFHLCESCAREKGEAIQGTANGFSIHNLLSGLLELDPNFSQNAVSNNRDSIRCEQCGLSYSQFRKLGKFGCSACYDHFGERLNPLLKRVHGNTVHVGKVPRRSGKLIQQRRELSSLKKKLLLMVEQEEFEQAAKLRDQIRELERKSSQI